MGSFGINETEYKRYMRCVWKIEVNFNTVNRLEKQYTENSKKLPDMTYLYVTVYLFNVKRLTCIYIIITCLSVTQMSYTLSHIGWTG